MNPLSPLQRWRALALLVAFLLPSLACGSFAPRPDDEGEYPPTYTPRPAAPASPSPTSPAGAVAPATSAVAATPSSPAPTASIPPTAPAASPTPPGDVVLDRPARILAPSGVNIREGPSTQAGRVGYFAAGALVTPVEGPVQADGYVWWRVDDGHGKSGWVAGVNREGQVWLSRDIGEPRPVNRPVRLGDTVYVSVAANRTLAVRYEPGKRGFVARRLRGGTLLSVVDGPVLLDGMRWWKVRRKDGLTGWAAEGDRETRWLKPME